MPTRAQLEQEVWFLQEVEAPAHAALNNALRAYYGHTKSQTGSKGDANHLRGRHRSRDWVLHSAFCTDRAYAATSPRDKMGDGAWLRATDVGVTGTDLYAASRRLDAAVRAGQLPCVAEWFGTFDGASVVGWFEGHFSSADSSHLSHLHIGLWTESCNDSTQLDSLYQTITGDVMPTAQEVADAIWSKILTRQDGQKAMAGTYLANGFMRIASIQYKLDGLIEAVAALAAGQGNTDVAAILAHIDVKVAELAAQTRADAQELLADLASGGLEKVLGDNTPAVAS